MSLVKRRKWFKKWHKWPSLILSVFILFFAISGIILNHRQLFSGLEVNRNCIPKVYRYNNWNLASVKGAIQLGPDSALIFGNIGVWSVNADFTKFSTFNDGFRGGIDNRKISSLARSSDGGLYAGTLFGLYQYSGVEKAWQRVPLPVKEERIVKVSVRADSLWVMTRSNLIVAQLGRFPLQFVLVNIPAATDYDNKVGLFRTLWVIHSGEIYGWFGRLLVDVVGLVFVFLTLTGIIYFIAPSIRKKLNEKMKYSWKRFNKGVLRWHNVTGSWLIPVLLLTTITGMFLRPPLLISISDSRVEKIPYTMLSGPNPWNDRLRDFLYDEENKRFMMVTSEGIYYSDDHFSSALHLFSVQPPQSVMGVNVFEKKGDGNFLIGSFSGLYLWNPENGRIFDYITGKPLTDRETEGKPFGEFSIAGYIQKSSGQEVVFDYARGAMFTEIPQAAGSKLLHSFLPMPSQLLSECPMSLWNLALEFHTCRIYSVIIGDFYILLIPLLGLGILFILVTGFFSWYFAREIKRKRAPSGNKSVDYTDTE